MNFLRRLFRTPRYIVFIPRDSMAPTGRIQDWLDEQRVPALVMPTDTRHIEVIDLP